MIRKLLNYFKTGGNMVRSVSINGNVVSGDIVGGDLIINGTRTGVTINGREYEVSDKVIKITVEGDVGGKLETTSGDVVVNGNVGNVKTMSGDVELTGDIAGSVSTMSGDVTAGSIKGSVSTMSGDISSR